jgi:hypothetical protein
MKDQIDAVVRLMNNVAMSRSSEDGPPRGSLAGGRGKKFTKLDTRIAAALGGRSAGVRRIP